MHVVTVEFRIADGCADKFLPRMRQQAQDSLEREADCVHFDVCVTSDDPNVVFLYELYRDPAAFQVHLESDHFKSFDADVADWVEARSIRQWQRLS